MISEGIKTQFYLFLNDEISIGDFEEWVYSTPALEQQLSSQDYFDLIDFNFKQKDAVNTLKIFLESLINQQGCDPSDFEIWVSSRRNTAQPEDKLPQTIEQTPPTIINSEARNRFEEQLKYRHIRKLSQAEAENIIGECYHFELPANLEKCDLTGLNFSHWDLSNANGFSAVFDKAKLEHTKFDYANLENARFIGAFLNNASFVEANLTGAIFSGSKLSNVNFQGANLTEVDFSGAELDGTNFLFTQLANTVITQEQLNVTIENKVGYFLHRFVSLFTNIGCILFLIFGFCILPVTLVSFVLRLIR